MNVAKFPMKALWLLVLPLLAVAASMPKVALPGTQKMVAKDMAAELAAWKPDTSTNYYWWVASDLADGAVAQWVDRQQGKVMTNATEAKRPSKSGTNGVAFTATTFLTNQPGILSGPDGGATCAVWWIAKTSNSDSYNYSVLSKIAVPAVSSEYYGYFAAGGDKRPIYVLNIGPQYCLTDNTWNTSWHDVLIVGEQGQVRIWVDGVVQPTCANISVWGGTNNSHRLWGIGKAGATGTVYFNGNIQEVAWHISPTFTSDYGTNFAARLHTYRTNTYGP